MKAIISYLEITLDKINGKLDILEEKITQLKDITTELSKVKPKGRK